MKLGSTGFTIGIDLAGADEAGQAGAPSSLRSWKRALVVLIELEALNHQPKFSSNVCSRIAGTCVPETWF